MNGRNLALGFTLGALLGAAGVLYALAGVKGSAFEPERIGSGLFLIYEQRVETAADPQGRPLTRSVTRNGPGMLTVPLLAGLIGASLQGLARCVLPNG